MRRGAAFIVALLLLANVLATPAWSQSAAERGRNLYKLCQPCHSLQDGVTTVGPSLHGVFTRRAAGIESYTYSDALYGADFVWSPERLAQWLADPSTVIPGNKMLFAGMKDARQIADLIAYLKEATR